MADSLAVPKGLAAGLEPVPVWTPVGEQVMAKSGYVDRVRRKLLLGDINECRPKANIGSIRRIDGTFTGYR